MYIPKESRVGKKLSDLTTKRVIFLVLTMLLILPLFEAEFYIDPLSSWDYGLVAVVKFYKEDGFLEAQAEYQSYHEDRRRPIIYMSYELDNGDIVIWDDEDPDELRRIEKHYSSDDDFVAIFDLRQDTRLEAELNIAKTCFVCIVLTLGAIFFTQDANRLVLIPIERMIDRVKRIAKNPLALQDDDPTDILKLEKEADTGEKKT